MPSPSGLPTTTPRHPAFKPNNWRVSGRVVPDHMLKDRHWVGRNGCKLCMTATYCCRELRAGRCDWYGDDIVENKRTDECRELRGK